MWKKHTGELIVYSLITVGIVLMLLGLVTVFERLDIHVSGSREMWIGLIGAVTGGAFTLFGVLITLYKQEETDNENRRLENMPILGFEVSHGESEADTTVSYIEGELITTGFQLYLNKEFIVIKIRTVNNNSVFNFCIRDCLINGKKIRVGDAFIPSSVRITEGDIHTFAFDHDNINTNIFVLIRFYYEDIFKNKYYQDLPFIYLETDLQGEDVKTSRQVIEIRDLKQPIFLKNKDNKIEDEVKKYTDYKIFCK